MSHSNYRDKNWGGTEATNNDSKKGKDLHNNEMSGGKDNTRPTNPWNRPRPQFAGQPSQEGDIGPQDPTNQSDSAVPTRGGKVPMSEAFEQGKFRPRSGGRGRGNYRGGGRSRWQEHPDDMYNDSEGKDEAFSHMERRQSEHSDRARGVRGDFRGRGRNGRGDGHASQQYQQSSQDGNNFWGGTSRGRNNWHNRNSFRDSAGITQKGNNELPVALEGIVPVDAEEREILELFAKTKMNTGINFTKYQAIPVKCVPENVNPMETFESMNLEQSLMENVKRAGYTRPTPIQKYALPIVTRGRDLMACAQTGSGKTAAFLIPIIQEILSNGKARLPPQLREKHKGEAVPSSMILAPTRELTLQIHDEARKFCFRTGLRSVVIYGGVDSYTQRQELHRGCDIVVATPGRLWDLYLQGCMFFACVRTVILDEADRMLDLGFEEQIRHIMQNSDLPPTSDRQTLLFSATFPSMIQTLAKNYLRSYFFVTVGRVGSTTEGITQRVGYAKPDEKLSMVENLLQKDPNVLTLIFVERKSTAEDLKVSLMQASFRVDTIHGDRHQLDRERALNSFRNGDVTILVATDVASRGLDIPNVGHVIQYDMPSSMDDYIHRIGRTGRAGNVGLATAIFTDDDARIATELVEILREHNQSVPEWLSDVMLRTIQDKSRNANYRHRR